MPAAHPLQLIDGASALCRIATLALGSRVTATKVSNLLVFTGEPAQFDLLGVTSCNLSIDKNMQAYSLLNDDGWSQSRTITRNFNLSLESYYVKSVPSVSIAALEAGFAILHDASMGDEVEVYIKLLKYLGAGTTIAANTVFPIGRDVYNPNTSLFARLTAAQTPTVTVPTRRYEVKAGNFSLKLRESVPGDNMITLSAEATGQGLLIQGLQDIPVLVG